MGKAKKDKTSTKRAATEKGDSRRGGPTKDAAVPQRCQENPPDNPLEVKMASELIDGPPGTATTRALPLRLLTRHRSVAWQWMVAGRMQYPIPIGSQRPLSPFSSDA